MTASITDFTQFSELRNGANRNEPAALKEVAGQFEALFIQSMLKNMREASLGDPIFGDSESHEMFQGMLDQQFALEMANGNGIGLAEMLVRQLGGAESAKHETERNFVLGPNPERAFGIGSEASRTFNRRTVTAQDVSVLPAAKHSHADERRQSAHSPRSTPAWSDPESFARDVWPHAKRVAEHLNVAPEGVLAQAALETGWGKHVIVRGNGETSYNLFGIKAGSNWSGDSVARNTLEFSEAVPHQEVAQFRAYGGVGETFDDYAELLSQNQRYSDVRDHGDDVSGFADALQSSGYATDPNYAAKISRVATSDTMTRVLESLKGATSRPIAP